MVEDIQLESEISRADIRRAAMNLLARREHTQTELVQKVMRRYANVKDLIVEEISRLAEEGLQSDARMAENFISARVRRGQGPVKIKVELRGKGLDDGAIALAWQTAEVDWVDQVVRVAEKKFGSEPPADAHERAKRQRFLQQRGFTFDLIKEVY